jgi:hypothetical protein
MKFVIASLLILAGLLTEAAAAQWWRRRWARSGRWIARTISPHLLVASPAVGLFLITTGLTLVWPPGVILALLSAGLLVWVLLASGRRRPVSEEDLREPGEPEEAAGSPAQRRVG